MRIPSNFPHQLHFEPASTTDLISARLEVIVYLLPTTLTDLEHIEQPAFLVDNGLFDVTNLVFFQRDLISSDKTFFKIQQFATGIGRPK